MPLFPSNFYALLVGINDYHPDGGVKGLRGCVNDVDEMARLLVERFGVPPANIVTLTNQQATHRAITDALQRHLVERADLWLAVAHDKPATDKPTFLFHFSGHGSQARDMTGQEPDGMDETIVPYDSRTPDVYDIRDWELGQMIELLSRATDNITVVLDCCHSGSGTKDVEPAADPHASLPRRCPCDPRQPLTDRPLGGFSTRSLNGAGWELGTKHVLLAGCRDRELSNEMEIDDGGQGYWRGALSYFLQQELAAMPLALPLTYRELHERVRSRVTAMFANQTPQCEGDVERVVFGGLRPARDRLFTVTEQRAGLHWIDAGIAHGVRLGSLLRSYPPETRTIAKAGAPLALLEVVEERATLSGCKVVEGRTDLPLLARARIERVGVGSNRRAVRLIVADDAVRHALAERLAPLNEEDGIDVSPFVAVVDGPADFRVALHGAQLRIQDNSGALLCAPYALDEIDGLALDLAHIARFLNVLELHNAAEQSALAGMVTIEVKRLVIDAERQKATSQPIQLQPGGELVVEAGQRIVFELRNRSRKALFVGLFGLAPNFEIYKLFPQGTGAHDALAAGRATWLGQSLIRREQLGATLPTGTVEAREVFKVIASTVDVNFDLLVQEGLKSPFLSPKALGPAGSPPSLLDKLLAQTMGSRRDGAPPPAADEWTTAQVTVRTVARAGTGKSVGQ
jgi:hypothetical protein